MHSVPCPEPAGSLPGIASPASVRATCVRATGDRSGELRSKARGLRYRSYAPGDGGLLARWLAGARLNVPRGLATGRLDDRLASDPNILCRLASAPEVGGAPLGFYRLDLSPDGLAEVALVVESSVRRQGVGRLLLRDAWEQLERREGRGLVAYVRPDNAPAGRFFASAGFHGRRQAPGCHGRRQAPGCHGRRQAPGGFLRLERYLPGHAGEAGAPGKGGL